MSRKEPWEAVHVKCPFYLTSDRFSITCEGSEEGMRHVHRFNRMERKKCFMGRRCNTRFTDCGTCAELMRRYETRK